MDEFDSYQDPVKALVIQELTQVGWVTLIEIPIGNPDASPKDIQEALEKLHAFLYKADKVELSVQGACLSIRGCENKTLRVVASTKSPQEPMHL